jgi:hypothetical protein
LSERDSKRTVAANLASAFYHCDPKKNIKKDIGKSKKCCCRWQSKVKYVIFGIVRIARKREFQWYQENQGSFNLKRIKGKSYLDKIFFCLKN